MNANIYQNAHPDEEKFLRQKTREFTFSEKGDLIFDGKRFTRADIAKLIAHMRSVMHKANGIGLSANQIGLPYRMFVGQIPKPRGGENKLYAVFNPVLESMSKEKETTEEGCLSVVGTYGTVPRAYRVTLRGFDRYGKPVKIKAQGLLARLFQHEVGHLDGKLFIDIATELHPADHAPDSESHEQ